MKFLSKDLPSSEESAHDSPDGDVELFGNLAVGLILDIGHDDDGSEIVGHEVDGVSDFVAEVFAMFDVEFVAEGFVAVIGEVFGDGFVAVEALSLMLIVSVLVDVLVRHDFEEPRFAVGARFEFVKVTVSAHQRVLKEIFGVSLIFCESECVPEECLAVGEDFGFKLVMGFGFRHGGLTGLSLSKGTCCQRGAGDVRRVGVKRRRELFYAKYVPLL